jgi:uncharacterized protein YhbP (UPF0306 family)
MADNAAIELPQHVLAYLGEQKTVTLATASPSGVPRAATLLYVNRGPVMYVWIRPQTTTAKHVEQNPFVSFAIDEYSEDWRQTKGVQGNAECEVVLDGEEIARAALLFGQKFPDVSAGSSTMGIFFLRVQPTQLEFIDNTRAGEKKGSEQFGVEYHRDTILDVVSELPYAEHPSPLIEAQLQTMTAEEGEVIARQGGPADKFLILVEGEVEVVQDDDGKENRVTTLGAGTFFGEQAIMRDSSRTSTVRALKPTKLLAMDRDVFMGLVAQALGTTDDVDKSIRRRLESLES